MLVRLALESDMPQAIEMSRGHADEFSHRPFDAEIATATFRRYLDEANPTIFVAADKGRLAGYVVAYILDYSHCAGFYTQLSLLYVCPVFRGTRAAALLLKHFTSWSDEIGADEAFYGTSTSYKPERFARLVERTTGARTVGVSLKRARPDGWRW